MTSNQSCSSEGLPKTENKEVGIYVFTTGVGVKVTVKIIEGCITKTKADCFVHPTNSSFEFRGRVGETLLAKGGSTIKDIGNKRFFAVKSWGVSFICKEGPPGTLPCKQILHLNIPRCAKIGWKKTIHTCLEKVVELGYASVSIPFLGTGNFGESVEKFSECTGEAIDEYCSTKSRNILGLINIICVNAGHAWAIKEALDKAKCVQVSIPNIHEAKLDSAVVTTTGVRPKIYVTDTNMTTASQGNEMTYTSSSADIQSSHCANLFTEIDNLLPFSEIARSQRMKFNEIEWLTGTDAKNSPGFKSKDSKDIQDIQPKAEEDCPDSTCAPKTNSKQREYNTILRPSWRSDATSRSSLSKSCVKSRYISSSQNKTKKDTSACRDISISQGATSKNSGSNKVMSSPIRDKETCTVPIKTDAISNLKLSPGIDTGTSNSLNILSPNRRPVSVAGMGTIHGVSSPTLANTLHADSIKQKQSRAAGDVFVTQDTDTTLDHRMCTLRTKNSALTSTDEDSFENWEDPLLLIESPNHETFKIVPETAARLSQIKYDLVVVSIVGPYRSGKSYLMNKIANESEKKQNQQGKGFAVGDTARAHTKGIWIWCLKHPSKTNTILALMDSEGFGDVDKGDSEHDDNIFLLNILLCSTLIYNSTGVLNEDAVNKLEYIAKMADKIRVNGDSTNTTEETDDAFAMVFPHFIWVVRDFTLDLEGRTPNEYLEDALKRKTGSNYKIAKYNSTRDCITKYFPDRKCFVIPPPEFQTVLAKERELQHVLMSSAPKKQIGINYLSGKGLVSLAKSYTNSITNQSSIFIFKVWANFLQDDLNEAYRNAISIFEKRFVNEDLKLFDESFENAMRYFIANKCYDVRYLINLVMYMKKRRNGDITEGNVKGITFEICPGGTEKDGEFWKVLIDLLKCEAGASKDLLGELAEGRRRDQCEMTVKFEELTKNFLNEQRKAEETKRHHVVQEYKDALEKITAQYNAAQQNFDASVKCFTDMLQLTKSNVENDKRIEQLLSTIPDKSNGFCSIM